MVIKKLIQFVKQNLYLSLFIISVMVVMLVSIYRLVLYKPTYLYAKVKVGQGFWWSSTAAKPTVWLLNAIKDAKDEYDLSGGSQAKIENIRYYVLYPGDTYDIYLTLKLRVNSNKYTKKSTYKRSLVGIGAPIQMEFSTIQVNGTIIDLSSSPFQDTLIEKTIILTKRYAYPWEFDAIKIGDNYSNGEQTVFEVTDKKSVDTVTLSSDNFGNSTPNLSEGRKYITLTAKIKVKQDNGNLIFGEEQVIKNGKGINASTDNFSFHDYTVSDIK